MKKTSNTIFILLFIFSLLPFSFAHTALAETTPREAGIDEGMLYYWLRYGGIVPDSVAEELGFLGTGFAANPSKTEQMVAAIALQWIYGVAPTKGVANYSTSIVDDMQNSGYFDSEQAKYLRSAGKASLSLPTIFEPIPDNLKNKGATGEGLDDYADFSSAILGGQNRAQNDVILAGMALSRANTLSASLPEPGSMLPEQKGSRGIGKNTGSTSGNGSVNSASIGPGNSATENVYAKAFKGQKGQISKPTSVQNTLSDLFERLGAMMVTANPSSTDVAVNPGKIPSNIAIANPQKNITSTGIAGNGSYLGESNDILKQGAPPKTNMQDVANLANRNSTDQINNRLNQINNAQNHFPNDPNLNNLQNQFPPNQFNNLLNNRFPEDGSGASTPPPVTPIPSNTSVCDPASAVLKQQEVKDIADFTGLALNVSEWKISYFQSRDFLGTTIYLGNSTSTQVVDSILVPNPNSCIWVVYAESAKEGAYITDARSQTGIKFLFRLP